MKISDSSILPYFGSSKAVMNTLFMRSHSEAEAKLCQRNTEGSSGTVKKVFMNRIPMKTLVVMPTYNEVDNIELMVRSLCKEDKSLHILVVDDQSPDGTAEKVKVLQQEFPVQLHLLLREKKEGLGKAYLAAMQWFLGKRL